MRKQQTLTKSVFVDGFGFWSGEDVRLEFHPSTDDSGIRFIRTDLPGSEPIPASVEFRESKPRQTSLCHGSARVDMIEHVMAALKAMEIDNCDIKIDGAEMPGFDGSSLVFCNAIRTAGIASGNKIMPYRVIEEPFRMDFDHGWIEARPATETSFSYQLEYDSEPGQPGQKHPIGNQSFSLVLTPDRFMAEVAPARTFLMLREAEYLRANGLCGRVRPADVLVFGQNGPIDNVLRFENECARHKTLDMIGDLSLTPCAWLGEFIAYRTGHEQNAAMLRELLVRTSLRYE